MIAEEVVLDANGKRKLDFGFLDQRRRARTYVDIAGMYGGCTASLRERVTVSTWPVIA